VKGPPAILPAAASRRTPPLPPVLRGAGVVAVALLFLAAWLFLPSGELEEEDLGPAVRVCLVDASASVRRAR